MKYTVEHLSDRHIRVTTPLAGVNRGHSHFPKLAQALVANI